MNRFLAVLKDSYREAMNGWVLQVLLILVGLFLLFIFSLSTRQLTFAEELEDQIGTYNFLFRLEPRFGSPQLTVENVQAANPVEPWKSPADFDLVVTVQGEKEMEQAKKVFIPLDMEGHVLRAPVDRGRTEDFIKCLKVLKGVSVKDITPEPLAEPKKDPDKADDGKPGVPIKKRFRVSTTGTTYTDAQDWRSELSVFFVVATPFHMSPREMAYYCQNYIVNGIGGWIFCLLGVVITAWFVPNMMTKGALDLVIAKPIGRIPFLAFKYVGGLTFFLVLISFTVLGMWLAVGLRTGLWSAHFLTVIPLLTFQFAILYAVSTLFGVLARNALVAILTTVAAWALFFAIGKVNDGIHNRELENAKVANALEEGKLFGVDEQDRRLTPEQMLERLNPNRPLWNFIPVSTFPVFRGVHIPTPRTFQLDYWTGRIIAQGVLSERELKERGWDETPTASLTEVILVNVGFILLMLGLASWRFVTRDG
jgi:hypothetical protein